ncbi:hypothetical protein GCM10011316_17860 [Roseibium aquae]|uniref:Uncharacterized protein n=1 Tax=Roseibium aquae TaxID=1323746 RepID=A0A916TI55_9HYPH|nr:hypothetical protein GCM10011316_17860 [Roseibium aquae]
MGMQTKNPPACKDALSRCHSPDTSITVFDGKREITRLERSFHTVHFTGGDLSQQHEALGTPADAAGMGPNGHFSMLRGGNEFCLDLASPFTHIPKCAGGPICDPGSSILALVDSRH